MNKLTKLTLATTLIASSLLAKGEINKDEISQIQDLRIFKESKVTVEKGIDNGSVYILNIKAKNAVDTVFLTKDKKYLISGDVIDVNTGVPVVMPVDMSILKDKEALTYGTGSDEYIVFTDPECPYCKKFEAFFPQLKDKVKFKIYYYPLDFHENAYDLALYTLSKKTNEEKINSMLNTTAQSEDFKNRKISDEEKKNLKKILDEQIKLALEMGIRGTPSVFDTKGNKVSWVSILQKYNIKVK